MFSQHFNLLQSPLLPAQAFAEKPEMVRALEQEQESYASRLFHFKGMYENAGRHTKSLSIESASKLDSAEQDSAEQETISSRSQGSNPLNDHPQKQKIGFSLNQNDKDPKSRLGSDGSAAMEVKQQLLSELEQMKERFAKLLLGEDMSGGGKGVSSALALSNAITNLAASVFGEQSRLEPMPAERKARWRKEISLLLSVTDYIVEFVPSQQKSKDGSTMEIMVTRQRNDLHMNIPALRKLDAMLIDCLDNFKDQNEFYYVKRDDEESDNENPKRKDDKWWLPTPKVPPKGLSEMSRKFLQYQKECVNQVLKAAMAINAQVLSEMEIPENYIESLPKNGRASLGDTIYKSITVEFFDPDQFLLTMDLTSEHKILDLKNKIEASIVIWKRKMNQKDGKSGWGSAVSLERREQFEERAETILLFLKHRFPGISQSALDISKIQYNRDVGHSVLESYSRILESLAFTVISRIEDVLYADCVTQNPSQTIICRRKLLKENNTSTTLLEKSATAVGDKTNEAETPGSMTLFDFMGWGLDQNETETETTKDSSEKVQDWTKEGDEKHMNKLNNIVTDKKVSYLENLGVLRSPTSRH